MISPEQRGHGGVRQRPPLDLPPLIVPAGTPLEEWAVPVSVAAELVGIQFQGLHAQIDRGTMPAYLGSDGRKMIRLDDLADSRASRRQAAQAAELATRRADHDYRVTHPWPGVTDCTGPWEECQVCGPVTDDWERLGDELGSD